MAVVVVVGSETSGVNGGSLRSGGAVTMLAVVESSLDFSHSCLKWVLRYSLPAS